LARALIARLLAGTPEVILADEPIAGLDPAHTLQVMNLFRDLARAGRTVVIVLHDLGMAARFCERVVLLDRGAKVADGPPSAVLTPEILERHYRIKAEIVQHRGEMIVVPWSL
jgi:iron complex transport system ATP-binding protein